MSLDSASDESLARRAAAGERGAFDELVRRHRARVYALALRLCRDRDDAEDVLQETFIAAHRALGGFGGRARFSTWLYRIAANKSYDAIGRRRPQTHLEAVAEPVERVDPYEASGRRTAIERALDALPDEFREAAVLCDMLGLTPAEAAALRGVPEGTMKSRSFRARALLAKALEGEWEPNTLGDV